MLCPVDFSEPSRTALAYASAIAEHLGTPLDVLAVDDPLLAEVASSTGGVSLAEETERELRRFCGQVHREAPHAAAIRSFLVRTGTPAVEILRAARETGADLIVMGSHGRSGLGRLFFGSTTERVLRETPVPVLVTPDDVAPGRSAGDIAATITRVLAPVDLSPASAHQASVACAIAARVSASLLVAHAIEPVFIPPALHAAAARVDVERRDQCEDALSALTSKLTGCRADHLVVSGDPAEEIVTLARERDTGLIVIGLRTGGPGEPRMGSVTYRVLCQVRCPVLALPPQAHA